MIQIKWQVLCLMGRLQWGTLSRKGALGWQPQFSVYPQDYQHIQRRHIPETSRWRGGSDFRCLPSSFRLYRFKERRATCGLRSWSKDMWNEDEACPISGPRLWGVASFGLGQWATPFFGLEPGWHSFLPVSANTAESLGFAATWISQPELTRLSGMADDSYSIFSWLYPSSRTKEQSGNTIHQNRSIRKRRSWIHNGSTDSLPFQVLNLYCGFNVCIVYVY